MIEIPEEVFLLEIFFVIPAAGKKLYDPNNFLRRYGISLDICSCQPNNTVVGGFIFFLMFIPT